MKKILFILLLLICGCFKETYPQTAWLTHSHKTFEGIVMIATGWGQSPLCTGVLIKSNIVLTAGHCLDLPAEDLYIVHGCDGIGRETCKITSIQKTIIYPTYDPNLTDLKEPGMIIKRFVNDFGIIITAYPINNIKPANIYTGDLPIKTMLIPAGYGKRYGKTGILYAGISTLTNIYPNEFLARGERDFDPHPGDSGGPIYIETKNGLEVVGILSRGIISYTKYHGLAIYINVKSYLDWIEDAGYIDRYDD